MTDFNRLSPKEISGFNEFSSCVVYENTLIAGLSEGQRPDFSGSFQGGTCQSTTNVSDTEEEPAPAQEHAASCQ